MFTNLVSVVVFGTIRVKKEEEEEREKEAKFRDIMENDEYMPYKRSHHRSISQLIAHLDEFAVREAGLDNPGLDNNELSNVNLYAQFDAMPNEVDGMVVSPRRNLANDDDSIDGIDENAEGEDNKVAESGLSRCLPDFQFSIIESEYDETLGFPDCVTILSTVGDKPILVQRRPNDSDDEDDNDCDCDEDDDNRSHSNGEVELPFTSIYAPGVKFNSFQRKAFIPCEEISVRITDVDRSVTTHFLSPNLYTIEMTHGNYTWSIKRRYKHFSSLHQQLSFFRTSLNIPFPMRSHKEKRATMKHVAIQMADEAQKKELQASQSFKSQRKVVANGSPLNSTSLTRQIARLPTKTKKKRKLPRFPNRPESLILVESLPLRIKQLEEYLYNLLNISLYRNHHETLNFVEVSNLSFISGLGIKGKEGMLQKRTGSTHPGQGGCNFCGIFQQACCLRCSYFCSDVIYGQWKNRWFFIKETCFGYIRPGDGVVRAVILFDQGFDVSTGIYQTGMRKGLQIITNNRLILLKCWTRRRCKEWMQYFKQTANTHARDFTQQNPHMSYAPVRNGMQASWYVDGSSYMAAVADAIEAATEEIYIADWWLSPEIYMKRPAVDGDYWRLDMMLHRKASQGIKIFVLIYKEVEVALGINSYYSKQRLVGLHENIKVLRHPDHARAGVFFWAHHEKIVAIDQTYAFIGGIDLCYGRWDDFRHRLTDLGNASTSSISDSSRRQEACVSKEDADSAFGSRNSSRTMKTTQPKEMPCKPSEIQINPNNLVGTLGSNDISLDMRVLAPGEKLVIDTDESDKPLEGMKLNTPEMERKNVLDKLKTRGKDFVQMLTTPLDTTKPTVATIEEGKICLEDWHVVPSQIEDEYDGQAKYWYGKDYSNLILKDWMNLDSPFVDIINRSTTPRMPWHDVGLCVVGASARDVSRHFIQRWNSIKLLKMRDNAAYPYLMPKSYQDIRLNANLAHRRQTNVSCQLLRSLAAWSGGFIEQDLLEQSIHDAYIETISKAQHYIYIENQFFITMQMAPTGTYNSVRNQIGETLFKRILRAHKERKKFRVYVVMPLLPGFEGDVGGTTGNAVRAITHWNYMSISRGRTGILTRLKECGIKDPSEYIVFNSLRTHSYLNNSPITELIYVHSKLLIADDKVVICGSANINDRSMIGKRDSEIAALITDEEFEDGFMNEQKYPSGKFAGRLRKYLFQEHLGLLDNNNADAKPSIDVRDPVCDKFWKGSWRKIALRNTEIYDEVFKCLPTDNVKSYADLRKFQEEQPLYKTEPDKAAKRIENIQGFLVNLPLEFLANEVLTPPGTSKEGLIPTSVWT